jgi:hypothetical protein
LGQEVRRALVVFLFFVVVVVVVVGGGGGGGVRHILISFDSLFGSLFFRGDDDGGEC